MKVQEIDVHSSSEKRLSFDSPPKAIKPQKLDYDKTPKKNLKLPLDQLKTAHKSPSMKESE